MAQDTGHGLRASWIPGWILIAIGVLQLVFVGVTIKGAGLFNAEWLTLGAAGTLSGIGMAACCVVVAARSQAVRAPGLRAVGFAAVAAGVVYAGLWASLLGGAFFTNDAPRAAGLIAADVVVASWLVMAALRLPKNAVPGLARVATVLALKAAIELLIFVPVTMPRPAANPGVSAGYEAILLGLIFFGGYVVLAAWAIQLGRWLMTEHRVEAIAQR